MKGSPVKDLRSVAHNGFAPNNSIMISLLRRPDVTVNGKDIAIVSPQD